MVKDGKRNTWRTKNSRIRSATFAGMRFVPQCFSLLEFPMSFVWVCVWHKSLWRYKLWVCIDLCTAPGDSQASEVQKTGRDYLNLNLCKWDFCLVFPQLVNLALIFSSLFNYDFFSHMHTSKSCYRYILATTMYQPSATLGIVVALIVARSSLTVFHSLLSIRSLFCRALWHTFSTRRFILCLLVFNNR